MKTKHLLATGILTLGLSAGSFAQNVKLSEKEKDAIIYMREEEKLARDVYDSMFVVWDMNPFGNIRHSERRHLEMVKGLIDDYKLDDPLLTTADKPGVFVNPLFTKLYAEMVTAGTGCSVEALKIGAKIEELDLKDLKDRMAETSRKDILEVYGYLAMGSENHLRAFCRKLKMQGVTYEPEFLDKKEFEKILEQDNK